MEIQEVRDKLKELEKINLLCVFHKAFISNEFVQVVLDVISDEPNFVGLQYLHFDYQSQSNVNYVKAEYFSKFIYNDTGEDFDSLSFEEQIYLLERYLKNKLIIVKPYYYYNNTKAVFFKNGSVVNVLDYNENNAEFHSVPVITNLNSFESFKNRKEFPLPNVSKELVGIPHYLCYDNSIYSVNIDATISNDRYWRASDNEDAIVELNVNYDELLLTNNIIECSDKNTIYINKEALLESQKKATKKITSDLIENSQEIDNAYEDSHIGKTLQDFFEFTKDNNLCYSLNDIYNFFTCVCSSQLIILAGMSGTGKTKLPLKFAEYFGMTEKDNNLLFIPVSPSFTEPSDILGYLNPNTGIYTSSETRLVEFLKHASENVNQMHMVIFDEMNLAQIEFWFAPFISILEKDLGERRIHLYSKYQRCINDIYPDTIEIGSNVIFVGTINLDETTKNISDRLLDRSFIINLKKESFVDYKVQQSNRQKNNTKKFEDNFKKFMPNDNDFEDDYIANYSLKELEFFDTIHKELNKIDPQKGVSFRSVKNIALYLQYKPDELDKKRAFDYAFKQTIMKKINGTVDSIAEFIGDSIDETDNSNGILTKIFDDFSEISDFKECRLEIKSKILELRKYGYAR